MSVVPAIVSRASALAVQGARAVAPVTRVAPAQPPTHRVDSSYDLTHRRTAGSRARSGSLGIYVDTYA